ncbi:LLM class flavin-dependent oxidoreductase [Geodermatophilus sp. DSM 44513]|uniref:LLM class flavin-dependent oxidoreductase n=1 Tax=Geodermatophilus sp. DSM 44513 TaxID=1528104 RepID=UPI001276E058|nr:LLM class flavin-dependent oxidoreductase [Geodermatophilus sp. DSM 44513]WNV77051.1 LLM class flavin-dependent oxidoreductase [Geodermatophilus sp. DSM 44513]
MTRPLTSAQHFTLGLFSPNCSSGLAVTKVPERWSGSWADNLRLARLSDDVGIDFLLPIARWIGYGGETNFHESVLEPVAWAAGLLAATSRVTVFATVHTAFNHPVVTAKQLATVDQIGGGRAGINIVAGWNKPEYDTFGVDLPTDHDDRYALAQEWWDVVRRIWTSAEPFDHDGRFFHLRHVEGAPKPVAGPLPVLNAGSSEQGRQFAARNADFAFTIVGGPQDGRGVVESVTAQAREDHGRSAGVLTLGHVVCRPTRAEAEEYLHHYAEENADWSAVDNLMALQGLHAQSFTPDMLATFRSRFAAGHGSCPLVGSPDDVAEQIAQFAQAGFAGMTLAFVDYVGELEYFAQEVMPRLEARGVRTPR